MVTSANVTGILMFTRKYVIFICLIKQHSFGYKNSFTSK